MGDITDLIPIAIGTAIGAAGGSITKNARDRGRGQWMTPVGRPPRDLYANRWINFFANVIHEWVWIGFCVAFVGFVLLFPEGMVGLYVMCVGVGMIVIRLFGTPLCLLYAELAPQYEAEAAAVVASKSVGSIDPV